MILLPVLEGVVERGLLYSLVVVAVYLSSRIIRFDDLSIEGSFGIGGAVTAACLVNGVSFWLVLPLALIVGALTGMATGLLHTKLGLNNLISGIIVSTGLFSVSLKLATANLCLGTVSTVFTGMLKSSMILLAISSAVIGSVMWLLQTEVGFLLRAVGSNQRVLTNLGKSIDAYKIGCLALANAITALAGSLFVQLVGYFSIWSNVGMLIIALTGLILAEMMSSQRGVVSIIIGSIVYQAVIATTIELQFDQSWNKLVTAVLLIVLLVIKKMTQRQR